MAPFHSFNGDTPCFCTFPPNFRSSGWHDFHLSCLPPSHIQHPLWIITPANQSLSPSASFLPLACGTCEPWEKSELRLLNCYLLSLWPGQNSYLFRLQYGLFSPESWVWGPDHLIPLDHDDSASWNRADSASRRGNGSLSRDVILFAHLHLPKCWRSLFISFWKATFFLLSLSFLASFQGPHATTHSHSAVLLHKLDLSSEREKKTWIYILLLLSFLFEIRADCNWGVNGHILRSWMARAG